MKIGIISNLYGQHARGGAEVVVKNIATGLMAAGHTVFIISGSPWAGFRSLKPSFDTENNLKVFRFYPLNIFFYSDLEKHNALVRIIWAVIDVFNFSSARRVRSILEVEKPQLVLTHNLKGMGYLIPAAVKKLGIKNIVTLHDVQLVNPSGLIIKGQEKNWLTSSLPAYIYQFFCRAFFSVADVIVTPSQFLMDFYLKNGFFKDNKKAVLPNPSIFESQSVVERKMLSTGPKTLLFVGQIEKHKGINWLLHLLNQDNFVFEGQQLLVKVVGTGRELTNLEKLYPSVTWLGRLERQELKEAMRSSDFLIFPSLCYENSPTVIYEALSLGLPVIGSDLGGTGELVHDGENGFLFEAGNQFSFRHALAKAVSVDQNYSKLSENARLSVSLYTVENYLQELLDL